MPSKVYTTDGQHTVRHYVEAFWEQTAGLNINNRSTIVYWEHNKWVDFRFYEASQDRELIPRDTLLLISFQNDNLEHINKWRGSLSLTHDTGGTYVTIQFRTSMPKTFGQIREEYGLQRIVQVKTKLTEHVTDPDLTPPKGDQIEIVSWGNPRD
jgi:hypothetical protein